MKQEVQVMYVSRYDFIDETSGEKIKGCKITFASSDLSNNKDFIGYKVSTSNFPYEYYDKFLNHKFPVKCEVSFEVSDFNKKPKVKDIVIL